MKLEISKRAQRQIDKISRWWRDHRPLAPSMFLDELADVERLLRATPEAGVVFASHRTGAIRRVLMRGTKTHIYYRYRAERDEVVVLAVWGAPKKRGPRL